MGFIDKYTVSKERPPEELVVIGQGVIDAVNRSLGGWAKNSRAYTMSFEGTNFNFDVKNAQVVKLESITVDNPKTHTTLWEDDDS